MRRNTEIWLCEPGDFFGGTPQITANAQLKTDIELPPVYSKDEKSPSGRVKVAAAGCMTKVLAVSWMLPEVAAIGSETTKSTEPKMVANRHAGRASTTSPVTISASSLARLDVTPPQLIRQIKTMVINLVFMVVLF
jgi:hypothetical protein